MNTQPIQWSDFYKICVGMMNMQSNDFWNSSPREIYLAVQGFQTFNGGENKEEPMNSNRLEEMMELYPDG